MMPADPYTGNNNNYSPFQYTDIDDKKSIIPPPPPPFMIPPLPFDGDMSRPRKRTRTSPEQLAILEESFNLNPSPNSRTREQLSLQLGMPERSIQIWFQNRRAKVKNQAKRTMQVQDKKLYMQQQYAASAATAACQSAAVQQQQSKIDPNLYNYYYYYYFQQIQQQQHQQQQQQQANEPYFATGNTQLISPPPIASNWNNNTTPDLVLSASTSSSSTASRSSYKKHPTLSSERTRAHSVGPYPYYHRKTQQERHASLGPPTSHPSYIPYMSNQLYTSILEEPQPILLEQIYPLTTETLQIGTWKRVCSLQCQIDLTKRKLIWTIGGDDDDNNNNNNEGQRFRMDIDFNLIQSIVILNTGIEFLLHSPQLIRFYMTTNNNEWIQCHDFTQDQQGSCVHLHQLQGFGLSMELMEVLLQAPELEALVQDDNMTNNMLLLQDLHLP